MADTKASQKVYFMYSTLDIGCIALDEFYGVATDEKQAKIIGEKAVQLPGVKATFHYQEATLGQPFTFREGGGERILIQPVEENYYIYIGSIFPVSNATRLHVAPGGLVAVDDEDDSEEIDYPAALR